ncbi:MAG: M14 family zinc carboxypeptidase [Gemmatimonadota bacterium]
MPRRLAITAALLLGTVPLAAQTIPSPSEYLGIEIGADRTLADYHQIRRYFAMLDSISDRLVVEDLGPTTLGEPMILAVISSAENIASLDRIREIARRLADPRGLPDDEAERLIAEGRPIVIVTCNIHSTEIASSQMAMEWAHDLVSAEDPETLRRLESVVLLLVPSVNPDGQIMEVEWYRRWRGTPYEGGRMPWLYHEYVGHDNNRDWFMLTQAETRHLTRAVYHEWLPQVWVDHHQMGDQAPRMFIPPFSDPMDPGIHPLIWREINLIGANMAYRLEQAGKAGVIYGYSYDAYWIGGTRNTGWWKNITGLLTETASARMATPLRVYPGELDGGRKGLAEYGPQINHPNPWEGGVWRLRDIMDYQRIASDALLETAAIRREDLLRDMLERARDAIAKAEPDEAYVIRRDQRDYPTARRLAQLLADHGVEVRQAGNGDYWIPLAQPYVRFVREMLEPQRYPEITPVPGGEILPPYDVSAWTLPIMMGVEVERARLPERAGMERLAPRLGPIEVGKSFVLIDRFLEEADSVPPAPTGSPGTVAVPRTSPESARVVNAALAGGTSVHVGPDGTFYVGEPMAAGMRTIDGTVIGDAEGGPHAWTPPPGAWTLRPPRVATYKPWLASMDEGWTRWVLETYGFEVEGLAPGAIQEGGLAGFDALILPDIDPHVLVEGRPERDEGDMRYWRELPPEYRAGLGEEGARAIRGFVEGGGTLIAFDSSIEYVVDEFNVPVRNALAGVSRDDFDAPGTLLRVHVDSTHPLGHGLPDEVAVFLDDATALDTEPPGPELERWIVASYPADARDILLSGWIDGAERLERRAAAVALTYGRGRIALLAFRPQHRGQTHATFPFLFNALWWSVAP